MINNGNVIAEDTLSYRLIAVVNESATTNSDNASTCY